MSLGPEHFADFYAAVNGYPPFPWQKELVKQVVAHGGRWPAVLDLPTSAGKTSALDAAVFLLALEVNEEKGRFKPRPVLERSAAVRTFFVVDRRIVVDEAGEKARKLARLLNAPPADAAGVVKAVAERLRAFGGAKALHVSVLRGGMYRDGSWAESPTQPTICLSTVDQVGSRLLFRGYGVSPYQRAVHAGLIGNDTLILVDEAHLSRPFVETLKAVEFYRSKSWAEEGQHIVTPFQVVVMSATAGESAEPIGPMADDEQQRPPKLGLSTEDRGTETLKARLGATKRTRLEEVKGGSEDEDANRQAFAEKLAEFARELATPPTPVKAKRGEVPPQVVPEANVIGVVVNRVDTARRVYQELLAGRDADQPTFEVILLTGRIRPYDRDELLFRVPVTTEAGVVRGWLPVMEANRARPRLPDGKKLFVVATQTIECGANISLDALVTEAAPLDALRQRFGRLDRLGVRSQSNAVIVVRKDLLREDDPVYGDRVKATWTWLAANAKGTGKSKRIDFGIDAFDARLPTDPEERRTLLGSLCAPSNRAPVMMPAHVDDLVQTTVPPVPDPKPELFLHGPQSGPADVSIVWRADITEDQLAAAADPDRPDREVRERELIATVALVPPVSMEALPVPVWAVRKWLAMDTPGDVTDVEGEPDPDADDNRRRLRSGRPFLRWRGPDTDDRDKTKANTTSRSVGRDQQDTEDDDGSRVDTRPRPRDTIVVPSTYGGCDKFGWNPGCLDPVADVADDCSWRAKRRPALRVHPPSAVHAAALAAWGVPQAPDGRTLTDVLTAAVTPDEDTGEVPFRAIRSALRGWPGLPEQLSPGAGGRELPYPTGVGRVLVLPVRKPEQEDIASADDGPADDEGSNFSGAGRQVLLEEHCRAVQRRVEGFADRLGLNAFRQVLSVAAFLHDAGKADPRFQEWLFGNPVDAAKATQPIAKSGIDGRDAAAVDRTRRQAGWPKHARHEAMSVLLVQGNTAAMQGTPDPELLVHLIGTHHGRGRPLWPITLDDELPDGASVPERVECRLPGFDLHATGERRPEEKLTPFHAGWVDHFRRMVTKYGYWGLAYLEMLLVLADHRQSEAEREADE
jgi:CRISPR-associated endonuclease/helicase Cas3